MGLIVVGKEAATVITLSPFCSCLSPNKGDLKVLNAIRLAEEPEVVVIAILAPIFNAISFSNFLLNLPVVSHPSRLNPQCE